MPPVVISHGKAALDRRVRSTLNDCIFCCAHVVLTKAQERNTMRSLTGVKYEVVDRYYKADNVEHVDLDFLAKACYVLNCTVGDLLEYENE